MTNGDIPLLSSDLGIVQRGANEERGVCKYGAGGWVGDPRSLAFTFYVIFVGGL